MSSLQMVDDDRTQLLSLSSSYSQPGMLLNYVIFSFLFSVAHGTVDGVLAFASAELGPTLGSYSGFVLYAFYTLTALLLSKPFLQVNGPKMGVFCGLCGMLCYVTSFLLALMFPNAASPIFLTGAAVGGIGAGILWTSQGAYYTINATIHAKIVEKEAVEVKNNFATIFCALYLSLETLFKMLATFVFLVDTHPKAASSWRLITFGVYSASALISVLFFLRGVSDLEFKRPAGPPDGTPPLSSMGGSVGAVTYAILTIPRLQLLLPFQICFGFSAGFVSYYINSFIVAKFIGDGYIGSLSAMSTLSAVILSWPFAKICNHFENGKWAVMIFGCLAFLFTGLSVLVLTNEQIGNWGFLSAYFILHGAARGIFESTNKAVVSEYFHDEESRDVAFAAIYFTSGISGALGFICYQFMTRTQLALLNTILPVIALVCYHISTRLQPPSNAHKTKDILNDFTEVPDDDSEENVIIDFSSPATAPAKARKLQ